jgi:hypothetical protein
VSICRIGDDVRRSLAGVPFCSSRETTPHRPSISQRQHQEEETATATVPRRRPLLLLLFSTDAQP